MTAEQEENKKLIEKYPFLLPRNVFTGEVIEGYNYDYTELDEMPNGWKKSFGLQMVEELNEALGDFRKEYRIVDIKEKYGTLCWYDSGCTDEGLKVIQKYEELSKEICIDCGKPATKQTDGWINYLCEECYNKRKGNIK